MTDLNDLLRKAARHKMTPEEAQTQRESWVRGIVTPWNALIALAPDMARLCIEQADRIEELEAKLTKEKQKIEQLRSRLEWVRTQEETPAFISLIVADTLKGET